MGRHTQRGRHRVGGDGERWGRQRERWEETERDGETHET